MSRNFNNNNLTDTSILYTLQNLTLTIGALPTNNITDTKIQSALTAYTSTTLLNTLINNQVANAIYRNNLLSQDLTKSYTVLQNFSDASVSGLLTLSSNYTLITIDLCNYQ